MTHDIDWNQINQKTIDFNMDNVKQKTDDENKIVSENQPTTDEMENLYWHTHGSLLWQH